MENGDRLPPTSIFPCRSDKHELNALSNVLFQNSPVLALCDDKVFANAILPASHSVIYVYKHFSLSGRLASD